MNPIPEMQYELISYSAKISNYLIKVYLLEKKEAKNRDASGTRIIRRDFFGFVVFFFWGEKAGRRCIRETFR